MVIMSICDVFMMASPILTEKIYTNFVISPLTLKEFQDSKLKIVRWIVVDQLKHLT